MKCFDLSCDLNVSKKCSVYGDGKTESCPNGLWRKMTPEEIEAEKHTIYKIYCGCGKILIRKHLPEYTKCEYCGEAYYVEDYETCRVDKK